MTMNRTVNGWQNIAGKTDFARSARGVSSNLRQLIAVLLQLTAETGNLKFFFSSAALVLFVNELRGVSEGSDLNIKNNPNSVLIFA